MEHSQQHLVLLLLPGIAVLLPQYQVILMLLLVLPPGVAVLMIIITALLIIPVAILILRVMFFQNKLSVLQFQNVCLHFGILLVTIPVQPIRQKATPHVI